MMSKASVPGSRSARIWCAVLVIVFARCLAGAVFAQSAVLSEQWVGGWVLDDGWTFASIDFDGRVLSQRGQLSGLSNVQYDAGRVRVQARDLAIEGNLVEGQILGQVFRGDASGTAYFAQLGRPTAETLDEYVGTYQVSTDRWMLVTRTDGAERSFYLDDGEQVLLFPLLDGRFLSERGELITVVRDAQEQVSGLSIRRMYAPQLSAELYAPRSALYTEQAVQFSSEEATLSGTLLLPSATGPRPAIVLVHGAGALERQFYRVFADHFARQGIAALIYDQRGSGQSTGGRGKATIADLAQDALAGVRLLAEHPEVDPRQIGVWGISQGGRVVPAVAAHSEQAAFVIAVSAPGMSQSALQLWQHDHGATLTDQRLRDRAYKQWRFEQGWTALWRRSSSGASRDPAADWSQTSQPVLLIYGDQDQIVPVHESAQLIMQALAYNGTSDFTARLVRGADHNLMSSDTATKSRLVSAALEMMSDWVLERTAVPGELAHLASTQMVFELNASSEFGSEGRYGANATVWQVLAQLGLVLLCAEVFACAAWDGWRTCFGQRSTVDRDLKWMRGTRLWLGLSGSVNLIALVLLVRLGPLGSSPLFGGLITGDDPIWARVTSMWAWLAVSVAAVLVLLLAWVRTRRLSVSRGWCRYGAHLIATAGLFWMLGYWRVLAFRF